jgi:hypothetical protein
MKSVQCSIYYRKNFIRPLRFLYDQKRDWKVVLGGTAPQNGVPGSRYFLEVLFSAVVEKIYLNSRTLLGALSKTRFQSSKISPWWRAVALEWTVRVWISLVGFEGASGQKKHKKTWLIDPKMKMTKYTTIFWFFGEYIYLVLRVKGYNILILSIFSTPRPPMAILSPIWVS